MDPSVIRAWHQVVQPSYYMQLLLHWLCASCLDFATVKTISWEVPINHLSNLTGALTCINHLGGCYLTYRPHFEQFGWSIQYNYDRTLFTIRSVGWQAFRQWKWLLILKVFVRYVNIQQCTVNCVRGYNFTAIATTMHYAYDTALIYNTTQHLYITQHYILYMTRYYMHMT